MNRNRRLGRGLEALLNATSPKSESPEEQPATLPIEETSTAETSFQPAPESPSGLLQLGIDDIDENPFQPRREFNDSEIASLAASLTTHDLLQPVLVRPVGERYQLISGERRLRAAIRAGWTSIPAQIREADDRLVAELAIVENLQRKDLNPIEKALSFRRYLDEHRCTQEEFAKRLEIDRSTVTNLMRLLELPTLVQDSLRNGSLTAGHARALLPLGDEALQIKFCNKVQAEQLNVRQTEQLVSDYIQREDGPAGAKKSGSKNQHIDALQQEFKMLLGTKVDIKATKRGSGKIVVHFQNAQEFERIQALLRDQAKDRAA